MNKEVEKVLNEMALCDFTTPMDVTITVEESDDEVQAVEENKKSMNVDNFYECPTPLIGERYIQEPNLIKDLGRKPAFINKNTCQTIKESERKRKSLVKQNLQSKRIKTSKSSPKSTDHVCCVAVKDKQSSLESLAKTKESKIPNKIVSDTNNLKTTEVNNFIQDLLSKVSKAILHVIEAYNKHVENVLNRQNDLLFIQDSKKRYARIRQHYFQLAYCTTDTIILSQENNDKFTEEFLNNTIKIAEELTKKTLTPQEIQPFYYELILWVKNQKKCCQDLTPSPSTQNMPVLRQLISQQPQKCMQSEYHPVVTVDQLNTSQKAMQREHQPIVTVDKSNILQNTMRREYQPVITVSKSDTPRMAMRPEYQPVVTIEKPNTVSPCSNTTHNAHINIRIEPSQNQKQINRVLPPYPGIRETDPKLFYNDPTSLRLENHSNIDILTNLCNRVSNQINVYTHNVSNNVLGQYAYGNNTDRFNSITKMPPWQPQPYHSHIVFRQANHESNSDRNNVNETTQNAHVYTECRRSESTDSGFLSPHQFDSPVSQVETENLEDPQLAPIITHVTSLNPNALRLVEGSCHVCGKPTAKKCLQCYGSYYCSYDCQKTDWVIHQLNCGQMAAQNGQQMKYQ